ncbi:MAG: hypothetical protein JRI23_18010, partial [Deltaproteobacteria bacterium]|nr:hypothetical protein [Deltaproteobacteria bacterium]MBW2533738.1 hypothetical protein [Deltaproteobacteria bacterium]
MVRVAELVYNLGPGEDDFVTGFAIGIAAACVAATILWLGSQRFKNPWASAAERLGLKLAGTRLVGQIDGFDVEVRAPQTTGSAPLQATARVQCRLPLPLDLGLSIRRKGSGSAGHDHGEERVRAGVSAVDSKLVVYADDSERADPLVHQAELVGALLQLGAVDRAYRVTDEGVSAGLEGGTHAADRLGDVVNAARLVVWLLDKARHDLPMAATLA